MGRLAEAKGTPLAPEHRPVLTVYSFKALVRLTPLAIVVLTLAKHAKMATQPITMVAQILEKLRTSTMNILSATIPKQEHCLMSIPTEYRCQGLLTPQIRVLRKILVLHTSATSRTALKYR